MRDWVELEAEDLVCRSRADAEAAAAILSEVEWLHPERLVVSARCHSYPEDDLHWHLEVGFFHGFDWDETIANECWLRIAPHMADGATLLFRADDDMEHWQIRWEGGKVLEDCGLRVSWLVTRVLCS